MYKPSFQYRNLASDNTKCYVWLHIISFYILGASQFMEELSTMRDLFTLSDRVCLLN